MRAIFTESLAQKTLFNTVYGSNETHIQPFITWKRKTGINLDLGNNFFCLYLLIHAVKIPFDVDEMWHPSIHPSIPPTIHLYRQLYKWKLKWSFQQSWRPTKIFCFKMAAKLRIFSFPKQSHVTKIWKTKQNKTKHKTKQNKTTQNKTLPQRNFSMKLWSK